MTPPAGRLLILGGTTEAAALASAAVARWPGLDVVSSLAGVTGGPPELACRVRRGGFGGAGGLADWLAAEAVHLVVDATHPFAATIARNAAIAAETAGIPRLKLLRPMWQRQAGDRWIEVADAGEAAATLAGLGARRVLLTLGRRELAPFGALAGTRYVVRMVERPQTPLPLADATLVLARGPFSLDAELDLLRRHGIDALVAKASGGEATRAKIDAARRLSLPVVLLRRPVPPEGETASSVEAALAWLARRLGETRASD